MTRTAKRHFPSLESGVAELAGVAGSRNGKVLGWWPSTRQGHQNFPFRLKFNAKGILDCYEKHSPQGRGVILNSKSLKEIFKNSMI
ncbi:hypothetical protein HS088_TW04G01039 [Tripterygium wilfordii]|uniref:Uncharacterized protein n=1 Tax=Tripterygium wilfordii TaxID=458696 RepID=A0A7J7DRZ8_TRIWF|nr:hypothetical protein HS088_TW04G01039 [Tripterygium wilfordii]